MFNKLKDGINTAEKVTGKDIDGDGKIAGVDAGVYGAVHGAAMSLTGKKLP